MRNPNIVCTKCSFITLTLGYFIIHSKGSHGRIFQLRSISMPDFIANSADADESRLKTTFHHIFYYLPKYQSPDFHISKWVIEYREDEKT